MYRWRRAATLAVAAVAALTVGIASAAPAGAAVAAFKARVLVDRCGDAYTQTSSTGVTRGVLWCGSGAGSLKFFTGSGTSWTKISTGVAGKPVAFADDGSSYYAIYEPPTKRGAVLLLKRSHATGAQTKTTLRAASASTPDDQVEAGALLVSAGRYWAAFTVTNGAILFGKTLTKQNLVPSLPSSMPAVAGTQPALARKGTTSSVFMVVEQPPPSEGGEIVRFMSKPGGTWARAVLSAPGFGGLSPQIMVSSGGVLRASWLQGTSTGYRVVYGDNTSGAWVRRVVPGLNGTGFPRLRMFITGTKLTFVYSGHAAGTSVAASQVVVTQRSGTTWSTTSLGAAADRNEVLGAGGWSGKTIVVFAAWPTTGAGIFSRRQA